MCSANQYSTLARIIMWVSRQGCLQPLPESLRFPYDPLPLFTVDVAFAPVMPRHNCQSSFLNE